MILITHVEEESREYFATKEKVLCLVKLLTRHNDNFSMIHGLSALKVAAQLEKFGELIVQHCLDLFASIQTPEYFAIAIEVLWNSLLDNSAERYALLAKNQPMLSCIFKQLGDSVHSYSTRVQLAFFCVQFAEHGTCILQVTYRSCYLPSTVCSSYNSFNDVNIRSSRTVLENYIT